MDSSGRYSVWDGPLGRICAGCCGEAGWVLNGAWTRTLTEGTTREKKAKAERLEPHVNPGRTVIKVGDLIGQVWPSLNPIKRGN